MRDFKMTKVPSAIQSLTVNTDRISAASKQRTVQNTPDHRPSADFKRERPFDTRNADFVEIDGKRYYLNAPRGTYLNILV